MRSRLGVVLLSIVGRATAANDRERDAGEDDHDDQHRHRDGQQLLAAPARSARDGVGRVARGVVAELVDGRVDRERLRLGQRADRRPRTVRRGGVVHRARCRNEVGEAHDKTGLFDQRRVGSDVVRVGREGEAGGLGTRAHRFDVDRDRCLSSRVENPEIEAEHHLGVRVRECRVGITDPADDLDHLVARARRLVRAGLGRGADPVVWLLGGEPVIETRRDHPGRQQVDDRRRCKQAEALHRAMSARTWPMIGPTRSLHAQRHNASKRPAAATAKRNSGVCESACAAVHNAVLPMIANGAPPRFSSAAYSAPRNAISSPTDTTTAGRTRNAGRMGAALARAAAGRSRTAASAKPPRILRPTRDQPRPRRSAGQPVPTNTRARPPRTRTTAAARGAVETKARAHSTSRMYEAITAARTAGRAARTESTMRLSGYPSPLKGRGTAQKVDAGPGPGFGSNTRGARGGWLKSKSDSRMPSAGLFSRTSGRESGRPSVFGSSRAPPRNASSMNFTYAS